MDQPSRPFKRTRRLAMTTVMAAGGVSLVACGQSYDNVTIADQGRAVDAYTYQSVQECKAKDEIPDAACDKAAGEAVADENKAARFNAQASCEDVYGAGQCVPRSSAGGGSIWGPLIAGFVVGRMMDGGFGGRGLYRDWRDGGYYSSSGGRVWTDYSTGRTRMGERGFDAPDVARGPEKVMSRASVINRGGFGGRMSGSSFSGGSWGG